LAHFCANKDYKWNWTAPNGRSGGILVGLNLEKIIVQGVVHDNFLKFKLKNKTDSFEWTLITVYGAAQEEEKESFLQELVQACSIERIPLMVRRGGGFQYNQEPQEKNNARYSDRWSFLFNAVINSLDLRELELSERQYTWANNLQTPTFEKLDQIFSKYRMEVKLPYGNSTCST
jgi:hypothetical protein